MLSDGSRTRGAPSHRVRPCALRSHSPLARGPTPFLGVSAFAPETKGQFPENVQWCQKQIDEATRPNSRQRPSPKNIEKHTGKGGSPNPQCKTAVSQPEKQAKRAADHVERNQSASGRYQKIHEQVSEEKTPGAQSFPEERHTLLADDSSTSALPTLSLGPRGSFCDHHLPEHLRFIDVMNSNACAAQLQAIFEVLDNREGARWHLAEDLTREAHAVSAQTARQTQPLAREQPHAMECTQCDRHEPCPPRRQGIADAVLSLTHVGTPDETRG